jgi:hypothetical protein
VINGRIDDLVTALQMASRQELLGD